MSAKKNESGAERRHFFSRRSAVAQNAVENTAKEASAAQEKKAEEKSRRRKNGDPLKKAAENVRKQAEALKMNVRANEKKAENGQKKEKSQKKDGSQKNENVQKKENSQKKENARRPAGTAPAAETGNQPAEAAKKSGPAKTSRRRKGQSAETPAASAPAAETVQEQPKKRQSSKRAGGKNVTPLKIIPLGGLGEIGKNMTVVEYEDDILIIDCGLAFPDDDMPGIDLVIPDFSYVVRNRDKVRGIVITHGHEDHIGSLSYLLKELNVPVYSARLTIGLIEGKLKEAGNLREAKLNVVKAGDKIRLGKITVEFIAVNHSIPDSCGLAIFTPVGTVVHTGDFKIDFTPVDGQMIDLARFGELGRQGVLALLSDSTNAERPGLTPSESMVGRTFDMLMEKAGDRRIIVASFSSNIHRVQQLITVAERHGRHVVVSGRSMENVTAKALELGYLKAREGTIINVDDMRRYPDEEIVIATTGSQGEPMSALTRMARGDHRKITVTSHDFIIISALPIPGNEKLVGSVINDLMHLGADVIYERSAGIHVSGHGCQEEIKTIMGLTKPRFFIPVHGEHKHLVKNSELAVEMGIPRENVYVGENGDVIELTPQSLRSVTGVPVGAVLVDGSGVGDVGSIVLRDRRMLADEGLVVAVASLDARTGAVLAGPDIISRGFVYVRESEELITEAQNLCRAALENAVKGSQRDWTNLKQVIRDQLGSYIFQKTKRRPVILPVIQEIRIDR